MMQASIAIQIHDILIERFGGSTGLRDKGALEAALSRPYSTFDGNDLYHDAISKAAALLESMAINHPFVDGNKRIAYTLIRLLLLDAGYDITASENEKYELVIKASTGEYRFEAIAEWLKSNTKQAK
ncbi:type II toxin-antitoxin system death-on-curing family toxin [Mucilaginibacter sp.]